MLTIINNLTAFISSPTSHECRAAGSCAARRGRDGGVTEPAGDKAGGGGGERLSMCGKLITFVVYYIRRGGV